MESWKINEYTLEYDDDSHIYLVDGVIVPSVTQLLKSKFGNKYDLVNPAVLERAAIRGTAIHEAIEKYCKTGESDGSREVHNFNFLRTRYNFEVLANEVPIVISDKEPIAAGRLDLVLSINGHKAIADIKTTAVLDKEYLYYQLNLYRVGYMQSYGGEIEGLYGVHLKNEKRKLVNIPINSEIIWGLINEFTNNH